MMAANFFAFTFFTNIDEQITVVLQLWYWEEETLSGFPRNTLQSFYVSSFITPFLLACLGHVQLQVSRLHHINIQDSPNVLLISNKKPEPQVLFVIHRARFSVINIQFTRNTNNNLPVMQFVGWCGLYLNINLSFEVVTCVRLFYK